MSRWNADRILEIGDAAGAVDRQEPHDRDEVYYVLSGRARMRLGDEERDVTPGTLLYVGATPTIRSLRSKKT